MSPPGAKAIANAAHLNRLISLNLSFNEIGSEGAQALANSPHLNNLKILDLAYNLIEDEGAQALANASTGMPAHPFPSYSRAGCT